MSCLLCLSSLSQDHWDHVQSVNMTRGDGFMSLGR